MSDTSVEPATGSHPSSTSRLAAGMFVVLASVAAANLPVTIILARSLDPAGYGELQFLNRLAFIAISVAQLGLPHALSWAMTNARTLDERRTVYRFSCWTSVTAGIVVMGVALIVAALGAQPAPLLVWGLIAVYPMVNLLAAAIAGAARGLLDIRAVAAIRISHAICWLGAAVILLVVDRITLLTAVVALVGSQAVGALVALGVAARCGAFRRRMGATRRDHGSIWKFARRVFLGHTIWSWNLYLDQVVLGFLVPASQLGIYAVAAGLTLALNVLSMPIGATAQPVVQRAREDDRAKIVCGMLAMTIVLVGTAATVLALLAPILVPPVLGMAYLPAIPLIQILCVAVVFDGINSCLHGVLLGLSAPKASSRNAMLGLLGNIVGWFLLLPTYGILGAALTSVAAYGMVTVSMLISVRRRLPGVTWSGFCTGVAREVPRAPRRVAALRSRTPERLDA